MSSHLELPSPFEIYDRCRKHVVFVDSNGAQDVIPDVRRMKETGFTVEWNSIGTGVKAKVDADNDDFISAEKSWSDFSDSHKLRMYLECQPMGTHVYIASSWTSARCLIHIAESVGYAKEDIQIRGYGQKYQYVFCIACYTINSMDNTSTVVCHQCGKILSVSDHYSKRLDAVMGYITLDSLKRKGNQ